MFSVTLAALFKHTIFLFFLFLVNFGFTSCFLKQNCLNIQEEKVPMKVFILFFLKRGKYLHSPIFMMCGLWTVDCYIYIFQL